MEIIATFAASPAPFASSLVVSPTSDSIGDTATYSFAINISESLGKNPFVLIYFPPQISLSLLSNSACGCDFPSTTSTSCSTLSGTQNILEIDINPTSGSISTNTTLVFTVGNILNPSDPTKSYPFRLETY
jgi:hypothetical protein